MGFEFLHPSALLLLPLAALPLIRRRQPAIAWPGAATFSDLADRTSERIPKLLQVLALVAGIGALAGPRWAVAGDPFEAQGIAIMLAVDVSGSMAEPDFDWHGERITRLEALKRSLKQFIERRPQDRIGLVLFASQPEAACPLTLDHAALLKILDDAQPRGIPTESETNVGDAIALALARLSWERGRSILIVASDGEHNVPAPALTTKQAGQLVAGAGVPTYTIFTGPEAGPGQPALTALATMTGGRAFAANDAAELQSACQTIDVLGHDAATDVRQRKFTEAYPWLALSAFVLLTAAFAYSRGPGLTMP